MSEPWRPQVPLFNPPEAKEFAKKRALARQALAELPVPSDKKYSNWERLKMRERIEDMPLGGLDPAFTIKQPDFDTGVKTIAIPLAKAVKDWPAQVVPFLQEAALPAEADYFSALTGALYETGAVVVVPPGVQADITIDLSAEAGKLNAYRSIIIVNPGATATVTEIAANVLGAGRTTVAHAVEVYVKDGASLDYYGLQQWPEETTNLNTYRGQVGKDGRLNWLIGSFGSDHSQILVESALSGEGAASRVHGVFSVDGSQHLDQTLTANHVVGHTESHTYARGIAADTAKAVYRGMIKIAPSAHGSAADQNGHAMLMGRTAHADMIPGLEIDADDVTAGHGATVGQIDEEQLFYLMSRGMDHDAARDMIIRGFFDALLGKITIEPIRERFWDALARKQEKQKA